jgi:hypothetical protein
MLVSGVGVGIWVRVRMPVIARVRRCPHGQRRQQLRTGLRHALYRRVERLLIGPARLPEAADLAHKLERRRPQLVVSGRGVRAA